MPKPTPFLAAIALFSLIAATTTAEELRTYHFVPDGSLPYSASCGECGPPHLGARSDIQGSFTVSLNLAASKGTLLALNDQLVNYFDLLSSPTGPVLQPSSANFGIIPDFASYYDLPIEGSIEYAGDALILKSSGYEPTPDGMGFRIVPSFSITIQHGAAVFDMHVPIIDYPITVSGASAVQIPEHRSLPLAFAATALLAFKRGRRGIVR